MDSLKKVCIVGLALLCAGITLADSSRPLAVATADRPATTAAPLGAPGSPLLAAEASNTEPASARVEDGPKSAAFSSEVAPMTAGGTAMSDGARGGGACACGLDTEGNDLCAVDTICDPAFQCGASSDCQPGQRCLFDNCCGYDICVDECALGCVNGGVCGSYFDCAGAVVGACCDESTGICTDGVAEESCQPPFRWEANTLCDNLVPPCGGDKCAPPGDDCWTTPCDGTTRYDFSQAPIPADFFYDGSPPFSDIVKLGGAGNFPGDTLVSRLELMCFPDPLPSAAQTDIEIVQLNLVGCDPIDVGGQLFDVFVRLAPGPQQIGTLTATKTHFDGGTYTATLPIEAEFMFAPIGAPPIIGPLPAPLVVLQTNPPGTWLQTCCDVGCGTTGFFPGWNRLPTGQPCCEPTCHPDPAGGHEHCVYPMDCQPCPAGPVGACCDKGGICAGDLTEVDCAQIDGLWNPNASCSDPGFVCNSAGCSFDNGSPSDDVAVPQSPAWPFAIVDPMNKLLAATVDDFYINDQGSNQCQIDGIRTWIGHVFALGGSPTDYDGVYVTVYANATPKGPGGQPEPDGSHTEYFPGGVVFTQFVTDFTWAPAQMSCYNSDPYGNAAVETFELDIPVSGLYLDKKTKYWLEILVQLDSSIYPYMTGLMLSKVNHMHESQSGSPSLGVAFWSGRPINSDACTPNTPPAGSLMGVAFELNGVKCTKIAPAGTDCWSTPCGAGTQFDFSQTPIPADFFGQGSDPFTGVVELGMAMTSAPDTMVRRLNDMCFEGELPVTDQTPIGLVHLDLASCQPVIVTYDGGQNPVSFDLRVFPDGSQPFGMLTATKTNQIGGTFDSVLPVQAGFEFTDPSGQSVTFLPGLLQTLTSSGLPWIQTPPLVGNPCGNGGFYPGYSKDDPECCTPSCHEGPTPGHEHCVTPPECPECPVSCCLPGGFCVVTPLSQCLASGGEVVPACLGDGNSNGLDDACEKAPCDDCGPGPHWIDVPPCPASLDTMASQALIGIDTDGDCMQDVSMILSGPVSVSRTSVLDDSLNFPGTRPLDGHMDVIDTEIVSMSLSGGGIILTAGAGLGATPLAPSLGSIAEQPADSAQADSSFDVFFEVALGGGMYGYNHVPLQFTAVIDCVPPHATYVHPWGCVELYSHPVGGVQIGNLVTAYHGTFPTYGACCMSDGTCAEVEQADCTGFYHGDGTECDDVICTGACCSTATACAQVSEDECIAAGFDFRGIGTECPTQNTRSAEHNSLPVVHWSDPAVNCYDITRASEGCIEGLLIDAWISSDDPAEPICHKFGVPGSPAIPADFFEPGSDPFEGQVCLLGEPLGATPYGDYNYADTLIERSADPFDHCDLPSPTEVTVGIEIVALNLRSISSMTVDVGGSPTTWDVAVDLSTVPSPTGTLTATKTHCNSGTYNSTLPVQPRFTFTKVSGPGVPIGTVQVLDTGLESIPPINLVQDTDPQWVSEADPDIFLDTPWCTDFHPGIEDPSPPPDCDCNLNGTNDACEPDCNGNGIPDDCDISDATSTDFNGNGIPDECELRGDMNCDLVVDLSDVEPFARALVDPAGYVATYDCVVENADMNDDGQTNGLDVSDFVPAVIGN